MVWILAPSLCGQSLLESNFVETTPASAVVDSQAMAEIQEFINTGKLLAIHDELGMVIDPAENNQYKLFPAYPDFKYAFFIQLPGGSYESVVLCELPLQGKLIEAERTQRTPTDINGIASYLDRNNRTTKESLYNSRIGLEVIGGAAGFALSGLFMYMVPELGTGPAMLWLGVSSVMTSYPVYYLGNSREQKGSFAQTFLGTAFAGCMFYAIMNFHDWQVDPESRYLSDPDYITYWAPVSILMISSSIISFNRSLESHAGAEFTSRPSMDGLHTQFHVPNVVSPNLFAKSGNRSLMIPILTLRFN